MIPKLQISGLSYSYHTPAGETKALADLSLSVDAGEFIAVVGPSGCGKSTLLSLVCGLLTPDKGEILTDGIPISENRSRIGYMLQHDHLFEWRTILENASLGLEINHLKDAPHLEELHRLLALYGLRTFEQSKPSQLSGGMRQRAALVRTLVLEPELLLLDEPFSALDYQTRLTVCDDISGIIRSSRKTAVLITHDLAEAVSTADRIVVLSPRPGRIRDILTSPFRGSCLSSLERRNSPAFSECFRAVWELLQN